MDTFRDRLKWLRKVRGFSQTDLANAADLRRGQITGYETDRYLPSFEILCKLSEALRCSLDFLMTGREAPYAPVTPPQAEDSPAPEEKNKVRLLVRPKTREACEDRCEEHDQRSPRPCRSRGV